MKTDFLESRKDTDLGGVIVASILIIVAAIAIWDTLDMTDADSFIFPRAIAIAMICFCILFIVLQMISPSIGENTEAGAKGGSSVRRIGLVLAMILSALFMPVLGFVISGALAFGSIMMLSMYDQWTVRRLLVFSLSGVAIVFGFYFMFAQLLLVPLPVGTLFE